MRFKIFYTDRKRRDILIREGKMPKIPKYISIGRALTKEEVLKKIEEERMDHPELPEQEELKKNLVHISVWPKNLEKISKEMLERHKREFGNDLKEEIKKVASTTSRAQVLIEKFKERSLAGEEERFRVYHIGTNATVVGEEEKRYTTGEKKLKGWLPLVGPKKVEINKLHNMWFYLGGALSIKFEKEQNASKIF